MRRIHRSNDQPRHLNWFALDLWIFLRDQGGWWSASELGKAMLIVEGYVQSTLERLRANNAVVRRMSQAAGDGVWVYGVTAACTPLPGEMLTPSMTGEAAEPAAPGNI